MQEAHGVGQPALGSRRPFPPVDCSRFERLHELRHDALKRRIAENAHAATPTVLYYSAGWQVVEEREDGIPTAQYVWSPVYVDAMILRDRDANANPADGLEQRHYVQHDANFNVTAITDPTGTVAQRYEYDPYGQATVLTGNWHPTTGNSNWQYLHQGGRYDPATTLHHFRNRDYSAELGRWVQQDPLGYVDGGNLYQYAKLNPMGYRDPSGLAAEMMCKCGPDVTDALVELTGRMVKWRWAWRDGQSERPGYGWAIENGMTLDWSGITSEQCPQGKKCANTYTLCGECVHDHWIGNFMYALILKMAGFSEYTINLGGDRVQRGGLGDPVNDPTTELPITYRDPPWDTDRKSVV